MTHSQCLRDAAKDLESKNQKRGHRGGVCWKMGSIKHLLRENTVAADESLILLLSCGRTLDRPPNYCIF